MIVDAAIVVFVGLATYLGLRRGIVVAIFGFLGFWVGVAAAVFGYRVVAAPIDAAGMPRGLSNLLAAMVIFSIVVLLSWVAGVQLTKILRWTKWKWVNVAAGGALGGAWALAWATVIVLAMSVVPVPRSLASSLERSTLAQGIIETSPQVLRSVARTDLRRWLTSFLPQPGSRTDVRATTDFQNAQWAERRLFDLANEERQARDPPPLRWDDRLARSARAHAADMYRRGFFGHTNPDGLGLRERLDRAGVPFALAGENLALAPNVPIVHNRFMTSEEHRKHVLDRDLKRIGIGVMAGRQGLLVAADLVG